MRAVAIDTWAFVETALDRPRRGEVDDVLDGADLLVTTRDVIAETCNFLTRKTGRASVALEWWDRIRSSPVRIVEPSLEEIHSFTSSRRDPGALSFTDHSIGAACNEAGILEVATADREFEAFGVIPLFAT